MDYGFPADEVTPISCQPYGPDYNDVDNMVRNDAMGNTSSTVLDNLDTLIIMEQWQELEVVLDYLRQTPDLFNQNTVIQVFEATIRSLGGLMSSHLLLEMLRDDPRSPWRDSVACVRDYDGFLLELALDLGYRLLPVYKTSTHIPVPRVNLARGVMGVPSRLQKDTCTSGATSPVLEFTLLSKLTGDPNFENYTQQTFWKLWNSRSALDLLPMTIDPISSIWKDSTTGIGASVDSFYEYAAKGSILFDDIDMWHVFVQSYKSLSVHSKNEPMAGGATAGSGTGNFYNNIDVNQGSISSVWIDSLGAFWAGLQVLTGQLADAVQSHLVYLKLWDTYDSIPERWDFYSAPTSEMSPVILEWYPLRPEFIESTYYLYRATRDPMYLQIGYRVFELLQDKYKQRCGFGGFQDVRTGEIQDRMETFVMSETLKYLYLLFDEEDEVFLHGKLMEGKNWVFSTEAHPLWYDKRRGVDKKMEKLLRSEGELKNDAGIRSSLLDRLKAKFNHYGALSGNVTIDKGSIESRVKYYGTYDQASIPKRNPQGRQFSQCEINPFLPYTGKFTSSAYYQMNNLFSFESAYAGKLVRPQHLGKLQTIELHDKFLRQFSLVVPPAASLQHPQEHHHLQCQRMPTTEFHDLMVGAPDLIMEAEITQFPIVNTHGEQYKYDLWVPNFSSLRLKVEKLTRGKVDSMNNEITPEYLSKYMLRKKNAELFVIRNSTTVLTKEKASPTTVLRILQVNGVDVDPRGVIWTSPYLGESIYHARNKRVVLQGMVVENLLGWW